LNENDQQRERRQANREQTRNSLSHNQCNSLRQPLLKPGQQPSVPADSDSGRQ
jgi:hypothetical protein